MFNFFFKETRIFGEREEAAVWEQREKKTKTKKKEKRKRGGLSDWCSQENEIRRGLLGQPKSDKRRGQLGWDTWKAREENYLTHFSTFLHSHSLFYKNNITLHTYIHTYIHIYIYPYLYKVISITLKEHICFIISQNQSFMHLKVIKIITCI